MKSRGWKVFLLAGIVGWTTPAGSAERCTEGSEMQGYWWDCSLSAPPSPPGEEIPACTEKSGMQGYWWDCDPPAPPDEEQPLGPPPGEEVLRKMLPKNVEKLLHDYRENALRHATEETVLWYYQLQDFARRRAVEFANLTQVVLLKHPELNMQTQYPVNPPGMAARSRQRSVSIDSRLAAERDRAALVFLSRATCPSCEGQRAMLRHFQDRHGWQVLEFDLDRQPDMVAHFGTDFTPTTLVIFRGTDKWMPVAVGVESLPRIEESVYRALRLLLGETSPGQFTLQEYQQGTVLDPKRSGGLGQ